MGPEGRADVTEADSIEEPACCGLEDAAKGDGEGAMMALWGPADEGEGEAAAA